MPLKICHISDIHWRGLERHTEYRYVFEKLYEKLENEPVDLIINTGDTWHTKLQHITPEAFARMREMFESLRRFAPVISIFGNHDLNLQNKDRHNILEEIVDVWHDWESFKHKDPLDDGFPSLLLKKSKKYTIELSGERKVNLYPFSMVDTQGWNALREEHKNKTDELESYHIALFHGSIANVELQNGYNLKEGELDKNNFLFEEFPFVMLGDIHKRQQLAFRRDDENNLKPYAAYAGSLIQQDFGETVDGHGGIIWSFKNPEVWDLEDFDISNPYQRHSVPWNGVEKTFETIRQVYEENKLDKRASFRVQHGGVIFSSESQELKQMVKNNLQISSEVIFAHSRAIERELEELNDIKPNIVVKSNKELLTEFIEQTGSLKKAIREEDYELLFETIETLEKEIKKTEENQLTRSVWKVKELWFDNIFSYGEGNYINFETLTGNVGLFGSNRTGKSSILGALCYVLFNGTDRGPIKNFYVINENKKSCRAKATFEINGELYCVERSTKRSTKNEITNTKVNFYKIKDGKTESLNGDTRDDTDKKIRDIIGIYQDFENTSFASQNELLTFIRKGSTEYKRVLSRYFNIDSYLSIGNIASKKKEKFSVMIAGRTEEDFKKNLLQKEEEIFSLIQSLGEKEELQVFLEKEYNKAIENLKSINVDSHKEYHSNEQLIKKNFEEHEQETARLKDLQAKSVSLLSSIEKLRASKDVLEEVVAQKAKLDKEMQEMLRGLNGYKTSKERNVKKLKLLDEIPCGTQFPNCSFIQDSFKAQDNIDIVDSLMQTLEKAIASQQALYDNLGDNPEKRYADALKAYNEASKEIVVVDQQVDSTSNRLEKLKSNNKTLEARQKELEKVNANENIDDLIKVLTDVYNEVNDKYNAVRVDIKGLMSEIEFKTREKKAQEQKFEELSGLLKNFRVLSIIAEAYSKNGIPAQILKDYMDSVNFFSGLVTKDTDFDVKVRVDSESNSLDIDYVYGGKTRPLETCSGAEKTFAALALRIALIQCSSIPTCNVLFLDECFGALDENMLVIARQLLSSLECYFDVILIISHEAYLKEMATDAIEIQREDGYSLVQTVPMKHTEWLETI